MTASDLPGLSARLAARLDRLPPSRFQRRVVGAMALMFFFELADLNTFSFTAPGIRKDLGVDVHQVALVTSAGFLGMFFGALAGGWLADRVGRRPAIVGSLAWYSVFSLLNAAAFDVPTLVGARLLTGVGLSALTVIAITYVAELVPAERRGRVQSIVLGFGLLGIPAVAFLARAVVPMAPWGWRLVFVFGTLGLLGIALVLRLPESPRWLVSHDRGEEAERTVERIEDEVRASVGELPEPVVNGGAAERAVTIGELFSPRYARRTAVLWVVWVFQTLGFYGFQSFVPTLLVASGFGLVHSLTFAAITTIGAVPGAFSTWFLSDRFGRKASLCAVGLATAVCGVLYGAGFNDVAIGVFGFLVGALIQAFAALLYAYTPELYPTAIRNGSSGAAYGVGRLANIAGPFIVAALFSGFGYIWVFVYIAGCWVVAALVVGIFGPDTRKLRLEQLNAAEAPDPVE
jgi:putative MFS transporter